MAKKATKKNQQQDEDAEFDIVNEDEVVEIDPSDDSAQDTPGNYTIGTIQVELNELEAAAGSDEPEESNFQDYEEIDDASAKAKSRLAAAIETPEEDPEENSVTFLEDVGYDPDEVWELDNAA